MDLSRHEQTSLGSNAHHLYNISQLFSDATYVDLGAREGWSSSILCANSVERNNTVIGVDVDLSPLKFDLVQGLNYNTILGDSVTVGKNWAAPCRTPIDILFVDTLHVAPQVMCELYYWTQHVKEGGYVVLSNTNWPDWLADNIGGVQWAAPVEGLKQFFGLSSSEVQSYEDNFIKVVTHPEDYGMTFVNIKKQRDFRMNVRYWGRIFAERDRIMSHVLKSPPPSLQFETNLAQQFTSNAQPS